MTDQTDQADQTDQTGPEPVGILGLGLMGTALADAFLAAGHPTTVWNRTPARADGLVARGAVRAATPADAATAGPLVVVCLVDPAAVRAVLDAIGGRLAGRTVVDLTTGTPAQARATAARVVELGARHLDGAILAVPPAIGTAGAELLFSGSAVAHDEHRATLDVLGRGRFLGSDPGLAALHDLALLGLMWSALAGFYHAAALLGAERLDVATFAPLAADWLTTVAGYLPDEAREIDTGNYVTDVSTVALNATAMSRLLEASRDAGIDATVPASIKTLLDRRLADGHGAEGLAGLVELIRPPRAVAA
jgi:3-hydroxyisobutyrate dehydrogenase-like beta-hydroxyacid dehydrogenase